MSITDLIKDAKANPRNTRLGNPVEAALNTLTPADKAAFLHELHERTLTNAALANILKNATGHHITDKRISDYRRRQDTAG